MLEDLVAATNELTRILVHQELREEHFRDATGIACKALNNLYVDREFDYAFTILRSTAELECERLAIIINEVDHFAKHFLRRELSMLEQEFKINTRLVSALRSAAHELREAVLAEKPELLIVKQRIGSLRDEACAISAGLKRILEVPARRHRLTKYALAGLGAVTLVANQTPVGVSYFSPAGSAASWKLGIALIGISSTGLCEKVITKIGAALS